MKQKITKGKVVQHCLKVTAAIVVAGGVGFQFHEIQGLEKDLNTLNNKHTATVHELKKTNDYANQVELQNQEILLTTEKLTAEVKDLKKDKKDLKKEKKALAEKNKTLQAKEKELSKQLIEERERPRRVSTSNSSSQTTSSKQVAKTTTASASSKTVTPKATKASANKVVTGRATAYTASCKGCTGTTASGQKVSDGMVAMDTWVPLGTKVRITIPGYGTRVYTVADRGGAIHGNKVDIFMASHADAIEFGNREVKIEILD